MNPADPLAAPEVAPSLPVAFWLPALGLVLLAGLALGWPLLRPACDAHGQRLPPRRRLAALLVLAAPLLAVLLYSRGAPPGAFSPTDAQTLLDQAVNLAIRQGERGLAGEPERLIQAALRLSPQHVQALALAGSARLDQGDAAGAVRYWEQLLPLVEPGSELESQIRAGIAAAQRRPAPTPADRPAGN